MNYANQGLIRFWRKSGIKSPRYVVLLAAIILIDQLSKYLIRLRQPAEGGFFICNKSIAFGIKIPEPLFWIFWTAIISFIAYSLLKRGAVKYALCLIFILAGAISNIIDRFTFGCVIDFIDLKFWPVFNLADSFIVIGGFILLAKYLKS